MQRLKENSGKQRAEDTQDEKTKVKLGIASEIFRLRQKMKEETDVKNEALKLYNQFIKQTRQQIEALEKSFLCEYYEPELFEMPKKDE